MVITTAQRHSTKPEPRFCAGSNPARGVSEIHNGEDFWQWSRLEIRLNVFHRSTLPQKQFIIIIIINCGTPIEKVSEFWDHHLQPTMKHGESYLRDTGNSWAKLKAAAEVPKGAILVTADVVGSYPSMKVWTSLKNSMKIILIKSIYIRYS